MDEMSGPSASAVWKDLATADGVPYGQLADATAADRGYVLPHHHRVLTDPDGTPRLSLTLLLAELPPVEQADLTPLVRSASLALAVGLAELADLPSGSVPLYAQGATTTLVGADEQVLASATTSGSRWSAALTGVLDRSAALAVWSALRGQGDDLAVVSDLGYRAVQTGVRTRLTGRWSDVHDVAASPRFGRSHAVGPAADHLAALFEAALAAGALVAEPAEGAATAYRLFAASARGVLYDADGSLGRRPSDFFGVDLTSSASDVAVEATVTLRTPLRDLLGGTLAGVDADRVVSLVAVGDDSLTPVRPRRQRSARVNRDEAALGPRFALDRRGAFVSTNRMLAVARPEAASLSSQLARTGRPVFAAGVHAAVLDLQTSAGSDTADLPVLGDPAGATFGSRGRDDLWYAPSFEVLQPAPASTADTSPFLFSFARSGATPDGRPGIDASVTFTLRTRPPGGGAVSFTGSPTKAIPTGNAQVVLDLPFRDETGATRRQRLAGSASWAGDVLTATVPLLNEWARLAYGALSQPGFQAEPARLCVAWTFTAWQQVDADTSVHWGGKVAEIPVLVRPGPVSSSLLGQASVQVVDPLLDPDPIDTIRIDHTFFDPQDATLHASVGSLRFRSVAFGSATQQVLVPVQAELQQLRELPERLRAQPRMRPIDSDPPEPRPRPKPRPQPHPQPAPQPQPQPQPQPAPRRWVTTEVARSEVVDVLFPCRDVGACYVERKPEGLVPIGCMDALSLGQTSWHQYEPLPALDQPGYRVHRSLQQPDRFLVQPTRYCLSRHAAGDLREYQPTILLYAVLDPHDPAANQVVIDAVLQPDVEAWAWDDLRRRLRSYAAEPVLELLTDVEGEQTFTWTLVDLPSVSIHAVAVAHGLAVTLQSDLAHALLLRDMLTNSGITGSVRQDLPDGSHLSAAVQLGLRAVAGPPDAGPVQVVLSGDQATLTNRIEREVAVGSLLAESDDPAGLTVPVEVTLARGEATTVTVPAAGPAEAAGWQPVGTVGSPTTVDLTEIRSFVEDISMNVIFLDLCDHAGRDLARLDVRAQLVGASGVQAVAMSGSPASGEAHFVLPLTTYLERRAVRYQVTAVHTDGSTVDGVWLEWDAAQHGSIIGLGPDTAGLPA